MKEKYIRLPENYRFLAERLDDIIRKSESFLLIPHVNMDGDALGSLLTFKLLLDGMGKRVFVYAGDPVPGVYSGLPGIESVGNVKPDPLERFDCAILMECPGYDRSPLGSEFTADRIVNLDHHPGNEMYGDLNIVDETASSAGELIYFLLSSLGYELTDEMGLNLYVAIYTDTGGFKFRNTTHRTHLAISELMERFELCPDEISRRIDREVELGVFRLFGRLIGDMKIHRDGVASVLLPRSLMAEYGVEDASAQNYARDLFQIRGIHTMLITRSAPGGSVKVSLRSIKYPVNRVAGFFGGGGHLRASGLTMHPAESGEPLSLEKAEKAVLEKVFELIDSGETLEKYE